MDLTNLKSMWEAYDEKLERTIKLNLHFVEQMQTQKIQSNLNSLLWYRIIEMGFHFLAVTLLILFLTNNLGDVRYASTTLALLAFYITAIIMCVRQIIIIQRMDYSNDIVFMQTSILKLRTHMINSMRIAVLFIPAFVGFPLIVSKAIQDLGATGLSFVDLVSQYPGDWWQVQLTCVAILTPLCFAFYLFVSEKHIGRPWVRGIIRKTAGRRIESALDTLQDLNELKKDITKPSTPQI